MKSTVQLKTNRDAIVQRGHPWIFSGAIAKITGQPQAGDVVTVTNALNDPIAQGFYNPDSDIAVRVLTRSDESIDLTFWRRCIRQALQLRRRLMPPQTNAYRLINAEGDGLPGLTVDYYNEYLVATVSTAGIERISAEIWRLLAEEIQPQGIYERSEGKAREREGLLDRTGMVWGKEPPNPLQIVENGHSFFVDIFAGQKTGFFLDQRDNRQLIGQLSCDASVLNCFSYSGGFSIYAARGKAHRVVSVEISAEANALAERNYLLNGLGSEQHPILKKDVFSYLRETDDQFDLIVLDPPAFAKSRKDLEKAARGYKDINLQAMKRIGHGGLLATFSCSNHIDGRLFEQIVMAAAADAEKTAKVLKILGPGMDHPILLPHIEGRYLKGLLLAII